tara:strand:+ start:2815 stop:3096 length:282 start_codon:yes stop_codon:yes gene_type:complete
MTTWLFQLSDDTEEAEMMGQGSTFIAVSEDFYNANGSIKSEHILDEMIRDTRISDLEARISEEAESFFSSSLSPAKLRDYLIGTGCFRETKLF